MKSPRLRSRYLRIITFFGGVTLRFILGELVLAPLGLRSLVRRTRSERYRREAVRFRALAIRMGGVMIKVGQFLSSRLDVLPAVITDELAGLQDEVPADDFPIIRSTAEAELGSPLLEKFAWFDEVPLAAASLGQVHRARLRDDEGLDFRDVVVKIQRPFIDRIVAVDLSALHQVGGWLNRYRPIREHADVPALLGEFSSTLYEEIDYLQEGKNAETFYQNFQGDDSIHVPRVVWSRTTRRVLTLEDVYAIKITDYPAITAAGIDRAEVARKLLDTYLKQIFEDGFVHADPHPGNLFVTPLPATEDEKSGWQLTFVDFGMTARLPGNLRDGLRELIIAIGTKDATRVVRSYQMLDMLLPGADLKRIEQAEAQVFDRFWGMSMSDLRQIDPRELKKFGHQYRDLMLSMPFQVPQNLLMLARTVSILSGMCTGLDPDFNLWNQLAPYARKLISDEASSGLEAILDQLGTMLKDLIALPSQAGRALARMEQGELVVQSPQVSRQVGSLERAVNRLVGSVIFTGLLLGGILLYNAGNEIYGQVLLVAAGVTLIWVLFFGHRRA